MEWTELILEHFVQIVHHIVWPATVLIILFVFRERFRDLIDRFTEYEGHHGTFRFNKTNKPPSPQPSEGIEITADLSTEAKKILSTIWEWQTYHFKDDYSKRWSFRILPNAEGYGIFMLGFAELLKLSLVDWTRKDGQALLTNKGIEYLKKHPEIQDSEDRYKF
ncbi:MAG: hypothetical protein WC765_08965 [Phycisphaerae bacterium]|jgi:hypothetical protein